MYDYVEALIKADIKIKPIEPYINMKTKILHKCSNGHIWSVKPTHIIHSRSGCPYCAGTVKITTDGHKKEVYPLTFYGEYKNRHSKLEYECQHGHKWSTTPHSIVNGKTGCPYCTNSVKLTTEDYIKRLDSRSIEVLGEYINNSTPLQHGCRICNTKWKAAPNNVMTGTGCPSCGGTKKKDIVEYVQQLATIGMLPLSDYINNKTPILHQCIAKQHRVYTTPSNLLTKGGCIFCKNSGPGTLYYIEYKNKLTGIVVYKIGITTKSIQERVKSIGHSSEYDATILKQIQFDSIDEARYIESSILKDLSHYRITVDFVANGNTEFFSENIMEYINART